MQIFCQVREQKYMRTLKNVHEEHLSKSQNKLSHFVEPS